MLFGICKQFFDKGLVGHRLAFRRKKSAEILLKGKQGFLRAPCGAYTLEKFGVSYRRNIRIKMSALEDDICDQKI